MNKGYMIYQDDETGARKLYAKLGEPPVGALHIKYLDGPDLNYMLRYIHPDLEGTEFWKNHVEAITRGLVKSQGRYGINSTVEETPPSYSPPGSVPDETKAGETEWSRSTQN